MCIARLLYSQNTEALHQATSTCSYDQEDLWHAIYALCVDWLHGDISGASFCLLTAESKAAAQQPLLWHHSRTSPVSQHTLRVRLRCMVVSHTSWSSHYRASRCWRKFRCTLCAGRLSSLAGKRVLRSAIRLETSSHTTERTTAIWTTFRTCSGGCCVCLARGLGVQERHNSGRHDCSFLQAGFAELSRRTELFDVYWRRRRVQRARCNIIIKRSRRQEFGRATPALIGIAGSWRYHDALFTDQTALAAIPQRSRHSKPVARIPLPPYNRRAPWIGDIECFFYITLPSQNPACQPFDVNRDGVNC